MRFKPWMAMVIIGSAVSGCVADGGELLGTPDLALRAPAGNPIDAAPGVLYVKVGGNGRVQLAPALAGAASNGQILLAPAVKLTPEQYYGNLTMKLCGADC